VSSIPSLQMVLVSISDGKLVVRAGQVPTPSDLHLLADEAAALQSLEARFRQ
jgi:hypothetical protein